MNHFDVLIATPGPKLEAAYVNSLVETLSECNKRKISFKWLNQYSSLVHNAREATISGDNQLNANDKGPLHDTTTYKKIFWIDSDIEWTVDNFFKLYDSPFEIISGAYLLADNKTSTIHTTDHPRGINKEDILKMENIIKVQSIGFGFVCIKQGVFEKIKRPWFSHIIQKINNAHGETLETSLGEDISWCLKAQKANIPIHFDPNVLVNHIKTTKLTWHDSKL